VIARSFNANGCYGESAKIVNVLDVSANEQFNLEAKINANLQLISSNWTFEKLEVFNAHGQLVYRSNNNQGIQPNTLSPGVYTYKIIANQGPTQVQKTGKWLNFER
jgi:acyl-ACP thioesterase